MKLSLDTPDVKLAVIEYVAARGINVSDVTPDDVTIQKLRGGDDLLIDVKVDTLMTATPKSSKDPKKVVGATKAKPEVAPVAEKETLVAEPEEVAITTEAADAQIDQAFAEATDPEVDGDAPEPDGNPFGVSLA